MAEPEPPTSSGTVDAQEHARVLKNYVDLSDQFAAANEVLSALGRSAGDPDAVLTTVVESARRLCRSQAAHLYLLEDGVYRLIKAVGLSEESIGLIVEHPIPLDRDVADRAGRRSTAGPSRSPTCWPMRTTAGSTSSASAGFRTIMGAPMLLDDEVVGALCLWRTMVSPFDEREMAIVSAFAGAGCDGRQRRQARAAAGGPGRRAGEEGRRSSRRCARSARRSTPASTSTTCSRPSPGTPSSCRRPTAGRSWSTPSADRRFLVRSAYRTDARRGRAAPLHPHRRGRDTRRARRQGATPDRRAGPGRRSPRPAPADPVRRRLALAGRGADAPRGPDRRVAHRPPQADGRLHRGDRSTCWRRSPASPRWPS